MRDIIAEIKSKCEQYWNEANICDEEIHAILEFIHVRCSTFDAERAEHQQSLELLDAELKRQSEALHFGTSQFVPNKRADELVRQVADLKQYISDLKEQSCTYHAPCEDRDA